jgi:IS6 family transposase
MRHTKGTRTYLYRAIDKHVQTIIDCYLSPTRTIKAARRFLGKALNGMNAWVHQLVIKTDKAPTYSAAMAALKEEGPCPPTTGQILEIVEADHGKLKRLINPTLGFQSLRTAYATIKGFEVMRTFRKHQYKGWVLEHPVGGDVRLKNEPFGLDAV